MLTTEIGTMVRLARAVLLVLAVCLPLAGCGRTDAPNRPTNGPSPAPAGTASGVKSVTDKEPAAAVKTARVPPMTSTSTPVAITRAVSPPPAAAAGADVRTIGHSVLHRPIRVRVVGDPDAARRILVVGCIHGNETAGQAITRRLRARKPLAGTSWWIVDEFNPDGCRVGTRQNANGVDLNRNSPWHWRPLDKPGGTFYSGPGPLSEPESQAINRLVRRLRPSVSIWYHQHAALVDTSSGGDVGIERRYAITAHLPLRDYGVFPGSITTWQDSRYPQDTAFCVELPAGSLSTAAVARHVKAILAL
jgi:murein peptide amidase A